jgi:hypothetical protein
MSSFPANVADDYLIFDGNEVVTLIPKDVSLTDTANHIANITGSVYSAQKKTQMAAGGVQPIEIRVDDRFIDLFVATITPPTVVKPFDRVKRADGSIWEYQSCALVTFDSRWHGIARKYPGT